MREVEVFGDLRRRVPIAEEELTNQKDKYEMDTDYFLGHRSIIMVHLCVNMFYTLHKSRARTGSIA